VGNKNTMVGVLIAVILLAATMTIIPMQKSYGAIYINGLPRNAPIVNSGDNVYVVWTTHPSKDTGLSGEVMFRTSTDGGKTFGTKVNLSNSSRSDSQNVQIDAFKDRVLVTWWERNATSDIPVMRVSTDNGKTFGSILKLATNGTLGAGEGRE
jgi:hypothetical protein